MEAALEAAAAAEAAVGQLLVVDADAAREV